MNKLIGRDFHAVEIDRLFEQPRGRWVTVRKPQRTLRYRAEAHYHPHVDALFERLNARGLDALLDPAWQAGLRAPLAPAAYTPGAALDGGLPAEEIDLSDDGPYSIYNWELFFHAPLLIAVHLSNSQRFEEAQHWFHRIFDPTSTDTSVPAPQRYWKFLRFRQETDPAFIAEILETLAAPGDSELKRRIEKSIQAWRDRPFQPHVVARGRYLAYQLNLLMKYLDNLIAWGDILFRQDTMESLNEATQLYVLAANLLGPAPEQVLPRRKPQARSFAQLKAGLDDFGNALVELENAFPFNSSSHIGGDAAGSGASTVLGIGRSLYFCVPRNDKLLAYWDRVADRLFKLRHCMNIEGTVRRLALFDPPIDPGMLVRAAAAGIDIGAIVDAVGQPTSTIRGPVLLQRAIEMCAEVKALGAALLGVLERRDMEHAALLRQQHEHQSIIRAREVRFTQWKEAEAATAALVAGRATSWERFRHYKRILGADEAELAAIKALDLARPTLTEATFDAIHAELVTRFAAPLGREAYRKETSVGGLMEFAGNIVVDLVGTPLGPTLPLNKNENAELNIFLPTADVFGTASTVMSLAAPVLRLIPQFNAHGTPLGVGGAVGFGGVQLGEAAKAASDTATKIADAFKSSAERASRMAGYYRRAEDYVVQANLAASELEQYGRQIIAALLREQAAKAEYDNQLRLIEDIEKEEAFLRDKFTNEELYGWMQGELSKRYFDCYKFAFDLARRAEQTLKQELMRQEFDQAEIIRFGYWDGGRKGLLAGDALFLDLKRLELAWLEQDRREYELTRHVSLARLDPAALLKLKGSGACEVTIPEWLFDLDTPGHYMRRLRAVSLTIPCVTGPHGGIHCKLSLLRSSIRTSALAGDGYARTAESSDPRFRDFSGAIQSIVTSNGQNDAGLFDPGARDDHYLPFEGAGAISTWRIELGGAMPQFDIESVTDVVFTLRYTAREAGQLKPAATAAVREILGESGPPPQLLSLKYDLGDAWHRFAAAAGDAERTLPIRIAADRLPYWTTRERIADTMTAAFAVIDLAKAKLVLAPATVTLTEAGGAWTALIDQGSPVFAFLKAHRDDHVHMTVSYTIEP